LPNGITVIGEYRDLPVVAFGIANKFGAAFEKSEVKGAAHFIEHLLFTGTMKRTHEQISREIEKHGGILNAFTTNEITNFWFKLPSEQAFTGIDILCDMLKNPKFDKDKFEKEKKVILEEIKMYRDAPQRYVYDKIVENLYEKPFGEGIIGSEKTIKAISREKIIDIFKNNYNPENYIACFVGKIDFEKLSSYLAKEFKRGNKKIEIISPKAKIANSVEERQSIDQAQYIFATHAPLPRSKDRYALEVLDGYLGNGMASKLFLTIREDRGLAYTVKSSITSEKEYSYYSIYVGTTKEAIPEVEKLILKGFKSVEEITEKQIEESKNRLVGLKKVSSEESSEVMNELIFAELAGSAEDYYKYESEIRKVTKSQVIKMAKIKEFSTAAIIPK
jgi:predicted Zn-dependent peptidase